MRNAVLFIAVSLDGYIADKNGGVSWLMGHGDEENVDAYTEFAKGIDTVLMGRNTYDQVVEELSPGEWIYKEFTAYVFTGREGRTSERIRFTDENPAALLKRLKEEAGKDIWICGGADLIRQLMREDAIDQYYISVIPVILGDGIRLFGRMEREVKLKLIRTRAYNGITELVYARRQAEGAQTAGSAKRGGGQQDARPGDSGAAER